MTSPQHTTYSQTRTQVDTLTDSLGLGIDEDIKETVTAFRVYGFATSQSCAGHSDQEHGTMFPWVEVDASESDTIQDEDFWTIENLKQRQQMTTLLDEFYQTRKTPFDVRLTFERVGAFGAFRIQSTGAETLQLAPPDEQRTKLDLYRQEMNDFTQFLKEKYLSIR